MICDGVVRLFLRVLTVAGLTGRQQRGGECRSWPLPRKVSVRAVCLDSWCLGTHYLKHDGIRVDTNQLFSMLQTVQSLLTPGENLASVRKPS